MYKQKNRATLILMVLLMVPTLHACKRHSEPVKSASEAEGMTASVASKAASTEQAMVKIAEQSRQAMEDAKKIEEELKQAAEKRQKAIEAQEKAIEEAK